MPSISIGGVSQGDHLSPTGFAVSGTLSVDALAKPDSRLDLGPVVVCYLVRADGSHKASAVTMSTTTSWQGSFSSEDPSDADGDYTLHAELFGTNAAATVDDLTVDKSGVIGPIFPLPFGGLTVAAAPAAAVRAAPPPPPPPRVIPQKFSLAGNLSTRAITGISAAFFVGNVQVSKVFDAAIDADNRVFLLHIDLTEEAGQVGIFELATDLWPSSQQLTALPGFLKVADH